MKILPVKDQIKFIYKDRGFIALGIVTDRVNAIRQVCWKNVRENTPEGYTWEDFIREAEKHKIMTADIFLNNDNLLIPTGNGLCNYKPCLPNRRLLNKKPVSDITHESDASGDESYYTLYNGYICYKYKHFSKGNFNVAAPALEICRIYKNLWLNNMIYER